MVFNAVSTIWHMSVHSLVYITTMMVVVVVVLVAVVIDIKNEKTSSHTERLLACVHIYILSYLNRSGDFIRCLTESAWRKLIQLINFALVHRNDGSSKNAVLFFIVWICQLPVWYFNGAILTFAEFLRLDFC